MLTHVAGAVSRGRTWLLDWCPCTLQRVMAHFLTCTLKMKDGIHYFPSVQDQFRVPVKSGSYPFLLPGVQGWMACRPQTGSVEWWLLGMVCLCLPRQRWWQTHKEGVTFPPEFVVTCNSFSVGRNKTKIYHQNATKQRNSFSFLPLWMWPGDQAHLDCGEEIHFLNREGN